MYSNIVMDHFNRPRNMGEIENPDGVGKVGNPVCGDVMWIYIKVKESKGKKIIEDIKFKTMGCAAAIATSSMVTKLAKGKTLEEASMISKKQVADKLGGLPPSKFHCSILATEGVIEAVWDYLAKNNLDVPEHVQKEHERIMNTLHEH